MIWAFLTYSRLITHSIPFLFPVVLLTTFLSKWVIDKRAAYKLFIILALTIYSMFLSMYQLFNSELLGVNWRQYASLMIGLLIGTFFSANLVVLKRNANIYVLLYLVITIGIFVAANETRYRAFATEPAAAGQIILYIIFPLVFVSRHNNLRNVNLFLCALGLVLTFSGTVYLQAIIALVLYILRRRFLLAFVIAPAVLFACLQIVTTFFPETYMSTILANLGSFLEQEDQVILSMTVFDKLGSFFLPALFILKKAAFLGYGLGSEAFLVNRLFDGYGVYLEEVLTAKKVYGLVSLHGKILMTFGLPGFAIIIGWAVRLFTFAVLQQRHNDQDFTMLAFVLPSSFFMGSFFAFGTLAFPVLWFVLFGYPVLLQKRSFSS